jgi:pyruvate-formate lyase-activating enzyme
MIYDFSNRKINIDSSHRCPLECHKCQRQAIRKAGYKVPGKDMPWNDFLKIANYFEKGLIFCGQISDPTANPLLIDMLKYCYKKNIPVSINTAASHKSVEWYEEAFDVNPNGVWMFGIDGLPKDSHKYRIHQDGEKLFEMVKLCAKKCKTSVWQYIVFRYNENDIEEARDMALANNIDFDLVFSGRWVSGDKFKPRNPNYYVDRHNVDLKKIKDEGYKDWKKEMDKLNTNDLDENWKKGLDKMASEQLPRKPNERFFTNTHNPVKTILSTRRYKK